MIVPATQVVPEGSRLSAGRVRRAALTWLGGVAYSSITVVVGLVATPLLVSLLGESQFGAYRVVSEWIGYLLLADLGVGSAIGVLLVRARSRGTGAYAAVVRRGLRVLTAMMLLTIPLAAMLVWAIPALVRGDGVTASQLRLATAVSAAGLLLGPLLVFRSSLEVAQRGYLVHAALLTQSLVFTALALLLAWRGWGVVGQAVAGTIAIGIFVALITFWGTRSIRTQAPPAPAPADQVPRRELWSLAWPLALAGLGNRLNLMTDVIVIGKMLGTASVSSLYLTQRLIYLSATQVNGLANASWAGLAELREAGRTDLFEARLAELMRMIVGAGILITGSVAALNRHFVSLWVGADLYGGDLLTAATLASTVVFGALLPCSWAIDMAGDTRHRLLVSTTGSILNLVLSVIFVREFGLVGVALGTLIAYLLTDAWYCPWLVCRRYSVRAPVLLIAVSRALLMGAPFVAGVWVLAGTIRAPSGWPQFIIEALVVMLAAGAYGWMTMLSAGQRREWYRRIRSGPRRANEHVHVA